MGKVVKSIGKAVGSVFKAVGSFVGMLFTGPKVPKATANTSSETRLQASLVPEEQFKVIFGETAAATDMRFWETFGTGNNGHVQVFAAACHEITAFGNLYLDEKPVSFSGNNAIGAFAGLLSRRQVLKGVSGAGIALGSGTRWTASSSMTGCAWFALIWTYNQEKMPQGIPSRITQVVKGAKVYDPRRDSTRGGSGLHRADDPATWEYLPTDSNGQPIGRNNALQMLAYTLGIKALSPVSGLWELRAGRGADPADVDFDTFIAAANACETEGWYSDCILSTGDSHGTNEGILEAAAGGELVDTGGRFSYYVSTDDTANIAASFDEGDVVGDIDWEPSKSISEQYNQLPGTFTDPAALFQTRPLPLCFSLEYYIADGFRKRAEPEKLSAVQDPVQGQKLLRRKLNKSRFQGTFTATFNLRGLKVKARSCIRLTFAPLGFEDKLFRVIQQGISKSGGIQLVLEEESAAIYLPGAIGVVPAPGEGFGGNPSDTVAVAGLTAVATGVLSGTSARDAVYLSFTAPGQNVFRTEGRYKKTGDTNWTPLPPLSRDESGWLVQPLLPSTSYVFEVRHVTEFLAYGAWASISRTTNSVTVSPAGHLVYSNGQTVESLRPGEAGANVTETRIANGILYQGTGATANTLAQLNPGEGSAFVDITTGDGVALPMYVSQLAADTFSIVGNKFTRNSGSSNFNQLAISRLAIDGPAQVSGMILHGNTGIGFTRLAAISGNASASCLAHWYRTASTWIVKDGDTNLLLCGAAYNGVTFNDYTLFTITDDGITQTWRADGITMFSRPTPIGSSIRRAAAYAYGPARSIGAIKLEPYNNAQWAAVSGIGRPDDNASRADNLVINWDFQRGFENWVQSNPGIYTLDGRWATYAGTTGNAALYANTPTGASLVVPNDMWVRCPIGGTLFASIERITTAARRLGVTVQFYSEAGVADPAGLRYIIDVTSNTSGTISRDKGSIAVPAGYPLARLSVNTVSAATGFTKFSKIRVGLTEEAANITENRIALGFLYQGSLATLNNLSWGGGLLVDRPLELTDGRISAGLASNGDVSRPLTVPILNSSHVLRRTDGGLYAGDLNATLGARAGTNIFRTDGSTVMTQAEMRTAEGIALGILLQAEWATYNTHNPGDIAPRVAAGLANDGRLVLPTLSDGSQIKNTLITLNPDGSLLGAGGGAVTPAGLGVPTNVEVASVFNDFQSDLENGVIVPDTFAGRGAMASADYAVAGTTIRDTEGNLLLASRLVNDMGPSGGVIEGGTKYYSNGQVSPIAGQAFLIQADDGEVVEYVNEYPTPPLIVELTDGLDALGSGEHYKLTPTAQSGSGFTARARRVSPGSSPVYTTRLDDGSGASDVSIDTDKLGAERSKSLSGVAYNETYIATVQLMLRGVVTDYDNSEIPPLAIFGSVPVTVSLYGKATVGGSWVYMGSETVYSPSSNTLTACEVIIEGMIEWATWEVFTGMEYRVAITQNGQTGARYITEFTSVSYQEQTGGSAATDVSALSGGRKVRYQITPRDG